MIIDRFKMKPIVNSLPTVFILSKHMSFYFLVFCLLCDNVRYYLVTFRTVVLKIFYCAIARASLYVTYVSIRYTIVRSYIRFNTLYYCKKLHTFQYVILQYVIRR